MTAAALWEALPEPPSWRYDWTALEALPPLAELFHAMAATPQAQKWHGEGNVLRHTQLVCEALCRLPGFRSLTPERRRALALAALLHDAGKPACTRLEEGQWRAPHHAAAGAGLVRSLLWREWAMSGEAEVQRLREAVCLLIRLHTRPPYLAEAEDPRRVLLTLAGEGELSPAFCLESLFLLAEADNLGRVAPDRAERLAAVALAREEAAAAGCLTVPARFGSDCTWRAWCRGGLVWPEQELYDASWGEVTLLCGLPGTGKDTWLRAELPERPAVSLDAVRRRLGVGPTENQGAVVQAGKEKARKYLRAREPFVWNATDLTEKTRGSLIALFEGYGARVRVVWLETGWEENLRRNRERPDAVPESTVCRMLDRLEPPARREAHRVEWRCV